ncbi:hypothetical protein [Chondrinema litorale]|uniref:hypothetical protein n=1 Tax=Chondrinema litorale TaxID=2994555 RepID=UPI002543705F|nr:hypothetical protein [Chondrinema litorale]UZR94192.1 hypothetical protein OQ292_20345 [Chondrinema litorale]
MKKKITDLTIEQIDLVWTYTFIKSEFENKNQNITPLKILEKIGVPIKDQTKQLELKNYRLRFKKILKTLSQSGKLIPQKHKHDTLGIKEDSYKLQ